MVRVLASGQCRRYPIGMLTPEQCRAARAMLKWSRERLAAKSGVAAVTVKGFESLGAQSKPETLESLRSALEMAGIEFIDANATSARGGPGVRVRKTHRK